MESVVARQRKSTSGRPRRRWRTVTALAMAGSLIAAACGGDEETSENGTTTTAGDQNGAPTTVVVTTTERDDTEAGPVKGGTLVYALEADTANPWAHYRVSCSASCYAILNTISDPLFSPNVDGAVSGIVIDTWEHNEDYTEWVFTIPEGITFHDGAAFDAEALKVNIDACRGASLTAPTYATIADTVADGQSLTISLHSPWAPLPNAFSGGHACSFMFSPDWLKSLPDYPGRDENSPFYDEAVAGTPADGDPTAPVGLGAYRFVSYEPGNGNSFNVERNEDYWRGPNGITGEDLPYLDAIELVVVVDVASRSNGLESGEFDIMFTANADEISRLQSNDDVTVVAGNDFGSTGYIMLNVAEGTNETRGGVEMDPEGINASSPMIHLSCRRALAHAIDRDRLAQERGAGIVAPANGPFAPGALGYLEDSGYPDYDVAAAQENFAQCQEDMGTETMAFRFDTTNDPFNVETNSLIISMWEEAFGGNIEATISPTEQGSYIGLALTGNFQAFAWTNHGGIDPDLQLRWWSAATAFPMGQLSLNFGRFQDPVINEALALQRTTSDHEARNEAFQTVNRAFGENVWNLWLTWTLSGVAHNQSLQGVTDLVTPSGESVRPMIAGSHPMIGMWCTDGVCDA